MRHRFHAFSVGLILGRGVALPALTAEVSTPLSARVEDHAGYPARYRTEFEAVRAEVGRVISWVSV